MRNAIDFSSWQGVLSTLLGIVVVSLVAVGIRLLLMHSVQQRRERENRQINERLKTLIAAYKTLGGSFTGDLAVDPRHRRDARSAASPGAAAEAGDAETVEGDAAGAAEGDASRSAPGSGAGSGSSSGAGSDRRRRIRDAVEAALSDVVLLGTEEQVRLAVAAANDMVAGRPVETAALVVSLRGFIRDVLDLEAIPAALAMPKQGPLRTGGTGARGARTERAGAGGGSGGGRGASAQGGGDEMVGGAAPYRGMAHDADGEPHPPGAA